MRSLASIRQQFSCPENIHMSLYSMKFLKSAHRHLEVEGEDKVDVGLVEGGYIFLASEDGEEVMRENHSLQRYIVVAILSLCECTSDYAKLCCSIIMTKFAFTFYQRQLGAHVELLNPVQLANKFPWLNTAGISLASFGEL